jgi:hypothetical protein
MSKEDLKRHGLVEVLVTVLGETTADTRLVRFDAARGLAYSMRDEAPDKVCDLLLEMISTSSLKVFKGTDTAITGTGDESKAGGSKVSERTGGDGRYMAAEAMGWLGKKAKSNEAIVAALRKAAKDEEPKLKDCAGKALKDLGIPPE